MTPVTYYDGTKYYLINSAHVKKVVINSDEFDVQDEVLLYSTIPKNAGSMWGHDDVLIVFNNQKMEIPGAFWVYASKLLLKNTRIPCTTDGMKIPDELALIIVHPCEGQRL